MSKHLPAAPPPPQRPKIAVPSGAIPTKAADGSPNGWLVPIWNALERPDLRPEQVYLTVVLPGCVKGPHLHMKRRGLFCCMSGNVRIVYRPYRGVYRHDAYHQCHTGEDFNYQQVMVPPGYAAAIYCLGDKPALVLNMPSPAWSKEDTDDWPVTDWNYKP